VVEVDWLAVAAFGLMQSRLPEVVIAVHNAVLKRGLHICCGDILRYLPGDMQEARHKSAQCGVSDLQSPLTIPNDEWSDR